MDTSRIIKTAFLCGWPLVIFAFNYFMAPDKWQQFLQHPIGQALICIALFLLVLGTAAQLLIQVAWLKKILFFLLVMLPSLVFMVGPAVLTIIQALGPLR